MDSIDNIVKESTQVAYDKGLISKEKDIVFTSVVKMFPNRPNVVGVFHVRDLVD